MEDDADANMGPPLDGWPSYNGTQVLLTGASLTSAFLDAVSWAGSELQAYLYSTNVTILDADILLNLTWTQPSFGIAQTDRIDFSIVQGYGYGICGSEGEGLDETMVNVTWMNLFGYGNIRYFCDSKFRHCR